ncbi:MAG: DUF4430 domain-containing protein [Moorellales bacterium]
MTPLRSPRRVLFRAVALALVVAGSGWLVQASLPGSPPAEQSHAPAPVNAIDQSSSTGSTEATPNPGPAEPEAVTSRPAPGARERAPAAAPSGRGKVTVPSHPSDTTAAEADGGGTTGPAPVPTSAHGPVVAVAVVGREGELLYGPTEVSLASDNPWGATALGALEATGLPYELSSRFPELVEAIAGQRNQGTSGWMYQVNGEVPMVAARRKTVASGDRIIWWYSRDLGHAPPTWEELVANKN